MNNITAKELFEMVKGSNEDISIVFLNDKNQLLGNNVTRNLMDVYHYTNDDESFYGVYGDLAELGQLDSREDATDEDMIKVVEEFMLFGKPINRENVTSDMKVVSI